MAINERIITGTTAAAADGGGTGNQEEGLILHLDANDVDSYDGDGSVWYDITNHEYTPAVDPAENFNTVLYTGNESSQSITGVGFQPDLVWIKNRGAAKNNILFDSIRGNNYLVSNLTQAQQTSSANTLSSFDSDGFSISGGGNATNDTDDTYVAWCFKAGGAAVSNTDGDVNSNVSVNNDLGFSIVEGTGSGTGVQTVGHGLDVPPEMVIIKNTNVADNWWVYHKDLGVGKYLQLNTTAATANWAENMVVNSTELGVRQNSTGSWGNLIAYCFASKRGVSKVGTYKGTGSAGNKVYTGFQPAFVLQKRTNSSGTSWHIFDNKRDTANPITEIIAPNTTAAESTIGGGIDFNADGFTLDTTNAAFNGSGNTYIYLAFAAEKPDSLIDDTDLELHLDAEDLTSSSTTWSDKTSNNNDGTITGADFDAELGNWLDFERSNSDNVSISDSSSLDISSNITLEAWINEESVANYGRLFWKSGAYHLYRGTNGWTFLLGTTSLVHNSGIPSTGTWYHIAATYDGSNQKLYINGELVDTEAMTGSIPTNNNTLYIGGDTTDRYFDGKIGQVRIYSSALTADEVMQNYRFTKNNYPNNFHMTITNAVFNSSGYFDFDGNGDYMQNNDLSDYFDGKNEFAVSAWFKSSHTGSDGQVIWSFSDDTAGSTECACQLRSNQIQCFNRISGSHSAGPNFYSGSGMGNNAWHHFVYQGDSTGTKIYIDNTEITNRTFHDSTNANDVVSFAGMNKFSIGANDDSSAGLQSYFDGQISKLKVYDRTLTTSEISTIYNEGE